MDEWRKGMVDLDLDLKFNVYRLGNGEMGMVGSEVNS